MVINYDRRSAVNYANRWALSRNPRYYDYNDIGGDCTSFASQAVYAGSGVMNYVKDFGWYYINPNDKSPSWTGVEYFYNFMVNNTDVGPFAQESDLSELLPGDIIQLGNDQGNFYHTVILTRISGLLRRRYYVNAHTVDAYQRDLFSYDFAILRGIHILGVRTQM